MTDEVEYLHLLGQVRGHLKALYLLHQMGAHEMSQTHAKHPESELYAELSSTFEARGRPGFASELSALVEALANDENVDEAYVAVGSAISLNEPKVDIATKLMAISIIARTAGDEFSVGVEDNGEITNIHEYQDAFRFLTVAREMLPERNDVTAPECATLVAAEAALGKALEQFDGLTSNDTSGKASIIYATAAKIEIAALGLG